MPIKRRTKNKAKEIRFTLPFSPGVFTKIRKALPTRVFWMNLIWSKTILIDVTGIILKIKREKAR